MFNLSEIFPVANQQQINFYNALVENDYKALQHMLEQEGVDPLFLTPQNSILPYLSLCAPFCSSSANFRCIPYESIDVLLKYGVMIPPVYYQQTTISSSYEKRLKEFCDYMVANEDARYGSAMEGFLILVFNDNRPCFITNREDFLMCARNPNYKFPNEKKLKEQLQRHITSFQTLLGVGYYNSWGDRSDTVKNTIQTFTACLNALKQRQRQQMRQISMLLSYAAHSPRSLFKKLPIELRSEVMTRVIDLTEEERNEYIKKVKRK